MRIYNQINHYGMSQSIERIEKHLLGEKNAKRESVAPKGVLKFSISSKGLTNQMSLTDVFVTFFVEDFHTGFELDKKSVTWKEDLDPVERKRLKNYFASIKRGVRWSS